MMRSTTGDVTATRAILLAGQAKCPACVARVRVLSPLIGEAYGRDPLKVWCKACCTMSYFAPVTVLTV